MLSDQFLGLLNLALFYWTLVVAGAILYVRRSELWKSPVDKEQATESGRRSETMSLTLGGFTLAALAVVIAFRESLVGFEYCVFFFSLSFTMLIMSVVFFAKRTRIILMELGGITQDYGLILIAVGLAALLDAVHLLTLFTVIPMATLGIFVVSWQVIDVVNVHRQIKRR
jgi:tellurite resistance protein TehA-like permease